MSRTFGWSLLTIAARRTTLSGGTSASLPPVVSPIGILNCSGQYSALRFLYSCGIAALVPPNDARIAAVETTRGRIATRLVVDAAGGRARDVALLAGVAIPTRTQCWEALVTESVRPFLRPGVALVAQLGYCHQTTRGEFVGGTEIRGAIPRDTMRTTLEGLRDAAQKFVRAFPLLGGVRVLRQWAGIVDVSPDFAPILGRAPWVDGLWLDCGWADGFMGAPGAAELLAEAIAESRTPPLLAPFGVERFAEGRLIAEASLVVAADEPRP